MRRVQPRRGFRRNTSSRPGGSMAWFGTWETPMRHRLAPIGLLAAALLFSGLAHAQGIDCSRARSPTEKAICASPALLSLDHQVGVRLRRRRGAASRMRATPCGPTCCGGCGSATRRATSRPARIERCLSGQLTARLAALTPATPGSGRDATRFAVDAGQARRCRPFIARPGGAPREREPGCAGRHAGSLQPASRRRSRTRCSTSPRRAGSSWRRTAPPAPGCSWWTCSPARPRPPERPARRTAAWTGCWMSAPTSCACSPPRRPPAPLA